MKRKFDAVTARIQRTDGEAFADLDEFEAYLTDEGVAVEELKAELLEPDGRPFGEYEVFPMWAEPYDAGEHSAAEYGGEVLHGLKSKHG